MKKLIIIITLFSLFIPYSAVFAADFNPNYIISDEELQNCSGWTTGDIQKFLEAKGSFLAKYRCMDANGIIKTAAQIIYDAATLYTINPKFLLVTLQKEQSLITDDAPTDRQLDWAAGFAVCDGCYLSDPKVAKYKGFGKQVDGAAGIMRWYYDNRYSQSFIKQKGNGTNIDNSWVTPQSWATAFLYTYTPHLHGNENFWRIWNMWFAGYYPNGTIVYSPTNKEYYLIKDGKKRKFKNMAALITRADPKTAVLLSDADLANYTDGPEISFSNYSILKAPSGYYLTDYDMIRPFASEAVVKAIGYNPQEIIEVAQNDLIGYVLGPTISGTAVNPQGEIYKIADLNNSHYLFRDNKLYPITDSAVIETNFPGLKVVTKYKKDISNLEVADLPVAFSSGSLLKVKTSNALYVIEDGKKRRVADEATFLAMGYKTENLIEISAFTALNIPDGEPLYISNSLAAANTEYLGDNQAPVENLFSTKLPAYLVAEYPTGKIIAGKNIDQKRAIASFVKLLTAYEAVNQNFDLNASTAYSSRNHASYGNPLSLITGEKIKNKDLLYSLLIASVNNVARMIAQASGLSESAFITAINKRLDQWGADNTTIADVTGLSDKNISTPRDILKIFIKTLNESSIVDALNKSSYTFKETLNKNSVANHTVKTTNNLLSVTSKKYEIIAGKTGYTDAAGAVLILLIKSKTTGKEYVVLTMGNTDYANRFVEPNRLAEWAAGYAASGAVAEVK